MPALISCSSLLIVPRGDRHAADGFDEFLDAAFADVQNAAQKDHGRRQPRTAHVRPNLCGNLGPGDMAAIAQTTAMGLMFRYLDGDLRQFDDLMPTWFGIVRARCHGQSCITGLANIWPIMHDRLSNTFGRQPRPQMCHVPRLTAGFFAGRLLANGWRCLGWIGRRRDRRVQGVAAKLCLQLAKLAPRARQPVSTVPDILHTSAPSCQYANQCRLPQLRQFYLVNGYYYLSRWCCAFSLPICSCRRNSHAVCKTESPKDRQKPAFYRWTASTWTASRNMLATKGR